MDVSQSFIEQRSEPRKTVNVLIVDSQEDEIATYVKLVALILLTYALIVAMWFIRYHIL